MDKRDISIQKHILKYCIEGMPEIKNFIENELNKITE